MSMTKLVRRTILIALIPALAIAAPRGKKKPGKKATTTAPKDTATEPTPTPPADTGASDTAKDAKATPPSPTATPPQTTPATPAGGAGGNGAGSGAGGGTGADKAAEPAEAAPSTDPDVDTLRQEYLSLRDELFKSRARANTVASQLYSTRVQIKLTYTTARFYNPAKSSIRLDGANVYEDTGGAIGGDDGVRFDGYVAPGRHLVTFHVEATGKDDDTFSSTTEAQIVVKAVAGKDLIVAAKAKDGGDIAYEWKRKERGSYGLGIDVSVKTMARAGEGENKSAPEPKPAPAKGAKK
jgi:hypothetical protein